MIDPRIERGSFFMCKFEGTKYNVKSSGFFLLGIVAGVIGVVAVDRYRRAHDPEDAEILSRKVTEHLAQLERRLESVLVAKTKEAV
jgi:hypothetical protein